MDPPRELSERQSMAKVQMGYLASEPPKVPAAVQKDRRRALLLCFVHLVPVVVSFSILQLSFRKVYWQDVGTPNQNAMLGGLQVVAKLHEILIVLSFSYLMLHYVRKDLISSDGLPFGLFEAAFRLTLGGQPFSYGLWTALKGAFNPSTWFAQWRALMLLFLVIIAPILGFAVGPASAITVIPKLGWWYMQDMFLFYQGPTGWPPITDFSMYIPKPLFPKHVTASSLPGTFCSDASQDVNLTCPYAGFNDILSTMSLTLPPPARNFLWVNFTPEAGRHQYNYNDNITLGTNPPRRMAYRDRDDEFFSMSSISNFVLADYMALTEGVGSSIATPYTVEVHARGSSPLSPIVNVACDVDSPSEYNRSFIQENRSTRRFYFDVRDVWNESVLAKPEKTQFQWRDVTHDEDYPALLGLVLRPGDEHGVANLTLCSIQSFWNASDAWVFSTTGKDLITNFTWGSDFDITFRKTTYYSPIHVHHDWAEALNAVNGTSNATIMETLLDNVQQNAYKTNGGLPQYKVVGQLLSKTLADGLSRIGSEFRVNDFNHSDFYSTKDVFVCRNGWCSQGIFVSGWSSVSRDIWNGTFADACRQDALPVSSRCNNHNSVMRSFPQPPDIHEKWTKISFPIYRYGYAYSFEGIIVYLATAVLIFHALLVLCHIIHRVVFDGQTFGFAGSLAELLALAMGDEAPTGPDWWKYRTAVRIFHHADDMERVKLVVMKKPVVDDEGRIINEIELSDMESEQPDQNGLFRSNSAA